jgi:poly(3-hydroxybutyrate) depolymerase
MLPEHDVYITDWIDARDVPITEGRFDLNDYVDYLIEFLEHLGQDGERAAIMAVCQPGPAALAASAIMAEDKNPARPSSLILMGSPIDPRRSPTEPNQLATSRPLSWFQKNVIVTVPWPNPGFMRRVYPGFLQLSGFMSMNLDRHVDAHLKQFRHLVQDDGDSAAQHRAFYDEYLAVMDMTSEFYLQTIDWVFQRRLLPEGKFEHRGRIVKPQAMTDIGLMTVEGENDDISGLGQTEAAHDVCSKIPKGRKLHYIQPKVGHYGVFNGGRFRREIQPRIRDFILADRKKAAN